MSTPMSLLLIGTGLIVVAAIAQKILEYELFSHLWFEIKKVIGLHKPTPQ